MKRAAALLWRWWRLPPAERRFTAHVWGLLLVAETLLTRMRLEALLHRRVPVAGAVHLGRERAAHLVETVAAAHLCHPRCLARAVVGVWALRSTHTRAELVLGCSSARPFDGHAWVRDGSKVLIGATGAIACHEIHALRDRPDRSPGTTEKTGARS